MDQQVTLNQSDGLPAESTAHIEKIEPATWKDYLHLTKPGIIFSNLLTVFTGFWVANATTGYPLNVQMLLFTLLGAGLVIASGTTLNNYLDREIDIKMKRTQKRALAAGRIHPRNALIIGIILLIAGLGILVTYANPLAAVLGLIGHITYVLIYTPLKRVTTLNTVIGAVSGAMPPIIGWTAVTNNMDMGAWLFFIVLFLWQMPHFLALAMMKVEDYRAGDVPMLPVVKGFEETKRQILNYTLPLVPASILLMFYAKLGSIYFFAALFLGIFYIVISWQGFKAKDDLVWARKAFTYSLLYLTLICAAMIISSM